jgi:cell division protein FtsQ
VQVTGALVVPVPDVLAAAAVVPGGPLAAVDTDAVAARVEGLPGVGRAEVSRDWPHTVVVEVFERAPVAVGEAPGGPVLVDAEGVGYAPAPAGAGLPVLTFGPVGPDDPATRAALAVLAALPEPLRADVREIDVAAGGTLTLRLAGDREVRWGGAGATAEKAAVLAALLTRPGRVYDVSSPALPTIRR